MAPTTTGMITRGATSSERCALADAVVVGAEGEGRRAAWAREVEESERARVEITTSV